MQTWACLSCKVVHHHWPTQWLDIKIAVVSMALPSSYSFSVHQGRALEHAFICSTQPYKYALPCLLAPYWKPPKYGCFCILDMQHGLYGVHIRGVPLLHVYVSTVLTSDSSNSSTTSSTFDELRAGRLNGRGKYWSMSCWCREVYHNRNVQLSSGKNSRCEWFLLSGCFAHWL